MLPNRSCSEFILASGQAPPMRGGQPARTSASPNSDTAAVGDRRSGQSGLLCLADAGVRARYAVSGHSRRMNATTRGLVRPCRTKQASGGGDGRLHHQLHRHRRRHRTAGIRPSAPEESRGNGSAGLTPIQMPRLSPGHRHSKSGRAYLPSRQMPSACWAGKSEIENSTDSSEAWCV